MKALNHTVDEPDSIPVMTIEAWKALAVRTWKNVSEDHVGLVAAGIAFYGLLALFPAITALVAISGLVLQPGDLTGQMQRLGDFIPPEAAELVVGQAQEVAGSQNVGLGFATLLSVSLAVYSASKGVASLMEGLNIAYNERESRAFYKVYLKRVYITASLIVGVIFAIGATLVLPGVLKIWDFGATTEWMISATRWLLFASITILGLAFLYRAGPSRKSSWREVLPGAVLACALWLFASIGFSLYVENFGSYNKSFGALAGVVLLLMWLWISAYVVLLGAEFNSEIENEVARQSSEPDEYRLTA